MNVISAVNGFVNRHPLAAIALVNFGLAAITRAVVLPLTVIGLDEGIYFLVAEQLAQGNMPFSVYFDHKPALIYYLLAVWELLTDNMILWARVQQMFVAGLSGVIVSLMMLKRTGLGAGYAVALGAAYVLLSAPFGGLAVIPENFVNLFALAALLLITRPTPRGGAAIEAAMLAALYALMLNVNYLSALAVVGLHIGYLVVRFSGAGRWRWGAAIRVHFISGLGFLGVTGLILLPIFLLGNLPQYFKDQIDFISGYREVASWRVMGSHLFVMVAVYAGFIVPSAIVLVQWRRGELDTRFRTVGLVYLAFTSVACFASGRIAIHYFILLLPGLVMLTAAFLEGASASDRRRYAGWVLLFALLGFVFAGRPFLMQGLSAMQALSAGQPSDVNTHIARDINKVLGQKTDAVGAQYKAVYVYHHNPVLYYLVETRAPTRYPFSHHHLIDSYGQALGIDQAAEMDRILATRPAFIVAGSPPHDGRFGAPSIILADELDRCYERYGTYVDFFKKQTVVYRRRIGAGGECGVGG